MNRIVILDYGSQYTQLIARRIREMEVYSEIVGCGTTAEELSKDMPSGIVLSGGPNSVFDDGAPTVDPAIFELGVPVLGICYGMQLMSRKLGGRVAPGAEREYGKMPIEIMPGNPLFKDVETGHGGDDRQRDEDRGDHAHLTRSELRQHRRCQHTREQRRRIRPPQQQQSPVNHIAYAADDAGSQPCPLRRVQEHGKAQRAQGRGHQHPQKLLQHQAAPPIRLNRLTAINTPAATSAAVSSACMAWATPDTISPRSVS